jgi:hypothetical protein
VLVGYRCVTGAGRWIHRFSHVLESRFRGRVDVLRQVSKEIEENSTVCSCKTCVSATLFVQGQSVVRISEEHKTCIRELIYHVCEQANERPHAKSEEREACDAAVPVVLRCENAG